MDFSLTLLKTNLKKMAKTSLSVYNTIMRNGITLKIKEAVKIIII